MSLCLIYRKDSEHPLNDQSSTSQSKGLWAPAAEPPGALLKQASPGLAADTLQAEPGMVPRRLHTAPRGVRHPTAGNHSFRAWELLKNLTLANFPLLLVASKRWFINVTESSLYRWFMEIIHFETKKGGGIQNKVEGNSHRLWKSS